MKKIFIDTNVIMEYGEEVFESSDKVFMHITVLEELDHINHSSSNPEKKYRARKSLKLIEKYLHTDRLYVSLDESDEDIPYALDKTKNDHRILSVAKEICTVNSKIIFVTDDLNLLLKAKSLSIPCEKFLSEDNSDLYLGYKEVVFSDDEMSSHYENPCNNWGLVDNEYLVMIDESGQVVDKQKWSDGKFTSISPRGFKSLALGNIKPKDVYQMLAIDSLNNNDFTILYGHAGVAKTLLSLGWIMQSLETGKIGKCVIVFNPAKLKNNEQLGFYTGSRTDKLLQNSIGGILSSKFGDMFAVETLIQQGKLLIIPTSDVRGVEISDTDCLFVTEAQNTDGYTMRTILQRAKEGCKIIIEGDLLEQQDIRHVSNKENGMIKAIEVFKGSEHFSCVKLKNVYRSPIADIAQNI